jgi:hypothetical protein
MVGQGSFGLSSGIRLSRMAVVHPAGSYFDQ